MVKPLDETKKLAFSAESSQQKFFSLAVALKKAAGFEQDERESLGEYGERLVPLASEII